LLLSLEEAVAILNKWKDESVPIVVLGQNTSGLGLRSVRDGGVDWNIRLDGTVSRVSVVQGNLSSKAGQVVVEGPGGSLSLSMDACCFSYDESSEGAHYLKPEAQFTSASRLFIFFPTNETFVVYELRQG
jgi:hypothetical protein